MADGKGPDNYQSDDDMEIAREEDSNDISGRSSRISPPKTAGPHSIISGASSDHSPATLQGATFMGDIPVRGPQPQYPPTMLPPDMNPNQHSYVESGSIPVAAQPALQGHGSIHMQDMMTSSHDTSRRTSLFSSPATEFSNGSAPNLYSGAWQQSTTAPANTGLYAFNTQTQNPPQPPSTFVPQQGVPLSQSQQYIGPQYHGLPHPNDMYRGGGGGGGGVSQSPVGHGGPGYTNFIAHDGRTMPGNSLKMEPLNRGPLH